MGDNIGDLQAHQVLTATFTVILVPDKVYVKKNVDYLAVTVKICVSMAEVVRGKGRLLSGEPRDLWHDMFRLSFYCFGAATVIFSVTAIVCVGLRERFLLVVGMSFLFLLFMWLVQAKELRSGYFGSSLLCRERGRVFVSSLF